jgi:hypothetical protein
LKIRFVIRRIALISHSKAIFFSFFSLCIFTNTQKARRDCRNGNQELEHHHAQPARRTYERNHIARSSKAKYFSKVPESRKIFSRFSRLCVSLLSVKEENRRKT